MTLAATKKPPATELMEKAGGVERKTEVVFFFGTSQSRNIEKLRELTKDKTPNVVVTEIGKDPHFQRMIKGEITADEYLQVCPYRFRDPESSKRTFEFFKELYGKGARIEQPSSELQPSDGWAREVESIKAVFANIRREPDFKMAVDEAIESAKTRADWFKIADIERAREIADKIKSGEWGGYVLVEAGALHTPIKNIVSHQLRGMENVSIRASHARGEDAEKVFGRGMREVYDPFNELKRMYMYGREPSGKKLEEREKLLGARFVVLCEISKTPKDRDMLEATKLVNQLGYGECRNLYNQMHSEKMDEGAAFELVGGYLKLRNRFKFVGDRMKKKDE